MFWDKVRVSTQFFKQIVVDVSAHAFIMDEKLQNFAKLCGDSHFVPKHQLYDSMLYVDVLVNTARLTVNT